MSDRLDFIFLYGDVGEKTGVHKEKRTSAQIARGAIFTSTDAVCVIQAQRSSYVSMVPTSVLLRRRIRPRCSFEFYCPSKSWHRVYTEGSPSVRTPSTFFDIKRFHVRFSCLLGYYGEEEEEEISGISTSRREREQWKELSLENFKPFFLPLVLRCRRATLKHASFVVSNFVFFSIAVK